MAKFTEGMAEQLRIAAREKKEREEKEKKKSKKKGTFARYVKMAVKGKRYKMSKAAHKAQKELGKKKKETAPSLLVRYAERRLRPKAK